MNHIIVKNRSLVFRGSIEGNRPCGPFEPVGSFNQSSGSFSVTPSQTCGRNKERLRRAPSSERRVLINSSVLDRLLRECREKKGDHLAS